MSEDGFLWHQLEQTEALRRDFAAYWEPKARVLRARGCSVKNLRCAAHEEWKRWLTDSRKGVK